MSVEMLLKTERDSSRDINDNDLDVKQKHYIENIVERKPTLVIPEPKRLSPLGHALTQDILYDRKSPSTSPTTTAEFPAFPQFPWQSPYFPALATPFPPYFPYRLPGFPFPPFPEHFPLSHYAGKLPDVRHYSTLGHIYSPLPFPPAALSSFHFPIRHDKLVGLETNTKDSDVHLMKCSYEPVKSISNKTVPKTESLNTPSDITTDVDRKKPREAEPTKYQCSGCQKNYSTFSGLSKHRQFHCAQDMKKEFTCKYCDKTYVSLGALKMHIRTHTLPCKCKICGKAFSRPWLLQGHIRTHTGEKPFSCVHCLRAFADRSNLRAHLQTHSDVKKYSCKTCSKTFSRMSLLIKHEESCRSVEI